MLNYCYTVTLVTLHSKLMSLWELCLNYAPGSHKLIIQNYALARLEWTYGVALMLRYCSF